MFLDDGRMMMEGEALRARNIGATLSRFGSYFGRNRVLVVLALITIAAGVWTNVLIPDVLGEATDCFLVPNEQNCDYFTVDPNWTTGERIAGLGLLSLFGIGLYLGGAGATAVAFFLMSRAVRMCCSSFAVTCSGTCSGSHSATTQRTRPATS